MSALTLRQFGFGNSPGRRHWAKSAAGLAVAARLTWPVVIGSAAVGVVLVGWSYRMSSAAAPANVYYATFWLGMLAAVLPAGARLALVGPGRADRAWCVALVGALTAVPKYLRNPGQPLYHDEYAHWREVVDVLSTGHLLRPNALIPIVQYFPGTSALTAVVVRITGLSVWSSGQLIVFVMHMLALFAVFVLGELHLRSARAGAVAALVYALNPSAMYFDTQYAYESIGVTLFLWVLALTSLAANARSRGQRVGFTIGAGLCSAACVVTHHLTTVFLILALTLVTAAILYGKRRAARRAVRTGEPQPISVVHQGVWAVVLGTTVVLAALWLVFVAWPTVNYLTPYFGGSVQQLASMAGTKGDGGRELLAASVQPWWERFLSAATPIVVGTVCLIGLLALRLERVKWPSMTLGLMTFGLMYFPSVPFVLAPSGAEGARRSWAFTYVGISLIVALVLVGKGRVQGWLTTRRWHAPAGLLLLAVVMIGNVGSGLNDPYRFPGPWRWGTDTNSASDEARTVARVLGEQIGPARVVSDLYTALQLVAYGGLDVAAPSPEFPAWDLVESNSDPSPELAAMLSGSNYNYLVVDIRMGVEAPFNGANFGPTDPVRGRAIPMANLQRLDDVPWATRIMATEHLRVYRLNFAGLGAAVRTSG